VCVCVYVSVCLSVCLFSVCVRVCLFSFSLSLLLSLCLCPNGTGAVVEARPTPTSRRTCARSTPSATTRTSTFSTPNYGITTNPAKEWALVLEGGSGCENAT
jgi:hypothetical protein